MVDTDQISTSADEPGLVIRNEDVFIEKVRERVALAEALGHLLSPVLLLQTGARRRAARRARGGRPTRPARRPRPTSTRPGAPTRSGCSARAREQDALTALAGGGELVVADGNHRSLAAQTGGLPRFLAVVTTPASVAIQPYNRLVSELTGTADELLGRLRAAGAQVAELRRPGGGPGRRRHHRTCTPPARAYAVTLPHAPAAGVVDNLDHALVERVLLRDALGLDPGDKRITYVGGDYPAELAAPARSTPAGPSWPC